MFSQIDPIYRTDILIGITTICLIIYVILYSNIFRILHLAFTLPGPPTLPIIGNAHLVTNSKELYKLGHEVYERYGRIFRAWISYFPIFFVVEPNDLQAILSTQGNTDKNFVYALMHNFIGQGLITNNGYKWKFHRKLIAPMFHKNLLETFIQVFHHGSKTFLKDLDRTIKEKNDINVTVPVNKTIITVLNESILGLEPDETLYENPSSSPFRQGKVLAQARLVKPWLLFDFIFKMTKSAGEEIDQQKNLHLFTKKILQQKREERAKGNVSTKSLLDKMIKLAEDNPDFTDEDIINEVCTFMLAGQDSVSSAVSFCLYFLAANQEIQERVFEEVNEFLPENEPNMSDLRQMTYLEQCIKETLRLCPSVPLFARKIGENVKIGKHTLPSGANVFVSPFVTHRLPHIYPDPLTFDPSRFSPEEIEARHPYAYLPFSLGPRNCIGNKFAMLEMKTIVGSILKKYHLSVTPGYTLDLSFRITLRAHGGIWLRFTPRTNL